MMPQSYTAKITRNSLWATTSFIMASLCGFGISIAVTRYFGKDVYGQYSYFLWLSSVLGIIAGFGFQQTAARYFPRYFFGEKNETGLIARKLLTVQIAGSVIISALCIAGVGFFQSLIHFDRPDTALLLAVTFLSVIPLSLNNFFNSSLTAVQEFKKLSSTYITTSVLNLLLILGFVATQQSILNFLWLYTGLNLVSALILAFQSRDLLSRPPSAFRSGQNLHVDAPAASDTRSEKLFSYSIYAYVSILSTQIVWERSELLFLGMFSDSSQIAVYTLAYSLAVLFISVWGPINGVLNATSAEVVASEKQDKLLMITRHGTKYLAMLILPLALLTSLFLGDVVTLLYGKGFEEVALLFPPLVFAHAIAVIITPAGSIPMLKHEMKKTMFFNISTAVVNIALDFYLITRYQAVGAMLSNVISQFFSIGLALINAKKYRLGIFNKYMVRVFFVNILMAGLFLAINPYPLAFRAVIALLAVAVYAATMLKTGFNRQDVGILNNLLQMIPKNIRPAFAWCVRIVEKKLT